MAKNQRGGSLGNNCVLMQPNWWRGRVCEGEREKPWTKLSKTHQGLSIQAKFKWEKQKMLEICSSADEKSVTGNINCASLPTEGTRYAEYSYNPIYDAFCFINVESQVVFILYCLDQQDNQVRGGTNPYSPGVGNRLLQFWSDLKCQCSLMPIIILYLIANDRETLLLNAVQVHESSLFPLPNDGRVYSKLTRRYTGWSGVATQLEAILNVSILEGI